MTVGYVGLQLLSCPQNMFVGSDVNEKFDMFLLHITWGAKKLLRIYLRMGSSVAKCSSLL